MKLDIVSKYRNGIYGFAILWIVVFHGYAIDKIDWSFGHHALMWLPAFLNVGNVGVDIFLFLSGICLYFSFHRKPDVSAFIGKRLSRVVIPSLIIYALYWLITIGIMKGAWTKFLTSMTLMRFWIDGDQTMWFVSLILVLYFAYPYIYHFLFDTDRYQWLRFVLLLAATYLFIYLVSVAAPDLYDQVEIALTRIPVFLMGCFAGRFVYEGRTLPLWCAALFVAAAVAFFVVVDLGLLKGMARRFFYAVGGIGLSYVLAWVFAGLAHIGRSDSMPIVRFFAWTGTFSLELYLAHIMVNQVVRMTPFFEKGAVLPYVVVMIVAFIVAWAAGKATTAIIAKLRGGSDTQRQCRHAAKAE